jgi:hypothetical protein
MKKIFFVLILLISISLLFAQSNKIEIISVVANNELSDYLNKIPLGQENMFGFHNRGEFSKAEIGIPYEMFTLNNEFFNNENIINNKDYIVSTNIWRVPIIVGNQYRALLTVSMVNREWNVVKIGAKGLAEELDFFNKNHPAINELKILRVFQLKSDFILTSFDEIYPLASAKNLLSIKSNNEVSYSLYDMLTLVKDIIIIK